MTVQDAGARFAAISSQPMQRLGRRTGPVVSVVDAVVELWRRRELVALLSKREIRARYKDSTLGIVWSLLRPLAQLLIYYFAIGKVLGVERSIPNFAVFVFVGLTGWTLYTEIVSKSVGAIVTNGGLVKKVYLPREVFPLASVGSALFGFAIQCVILVVALIAFGSMPSLAGLGFALLGAATLLVLGTAIGVLLSAWNVFLRDVEHLVDVVFVVFFWASPIVYSYGLVHEKFAGTWIDAVYAWNPVTLAVTALQRGLWASGGGVDAIWPAHHLAALGIAFLGALLALWVAEVIFARLQGDFAQEV